ncbi:hypothetical protein FJM67_03480 [Maribrevibacterium harenarium]|uniref:Flagellar hook-length control protein-like C-terminal domain-containing protein n=1 Tax=Maribrevibacterium harenarium TaxID=2589817 RepID=A0A501X2L5_9GAMM|nr:flagellar hook-length control protein FliK [Maribrevibacterium harenarium]TPE54704.1 hypothetical protein FJM67_03480 [Maribrevibacterium harenarium]
MVNSILNVTASAPKTSNAQSVGRESREGGSDFGEIFNDASQQKSTVEDTASKSEADTDGVESAEAKPARDSDDRHSNATAEKQDQDKDVVASQSTLAANQASEEVDAVEASVSGAEAEEIDPNIDEITAVNPSLGGTNLQPNETESAAENSELADVSATVVDEHSAEAVVLTGTQDAPDTVLVDADNSVVATEAQVVSDEQLQSTPLSVPNQPIKAQPVTSTDVGTLAAQSEEIEVLSGAQVLQSQALSDSSTASPMQTSIEERRQQDNLAWVLGQLTPKSDLASPTSGTLSPIASGISSSLTPAAGKMPLSTEALMSLVAGQTGVDVTESSDQLLYQSGVGSSSVTTSLGGAAAPATTSSGAALTMSVPPQSGAWPLEMAQKVSWVASEGVKTAHIQLDPPELGSLTIKVTMDQDGNTHVSFVAANAQSRDMIEGQMQRLRDMLQQQGIELDSVDVNVAQDNAAGQQGDRYGDDESAARAAGVGNDIEATEDVNISYIDPADRGIDFYA